MNIDKILVPVRGDSSDEEAVKVACDLAQRGKAKIFALYVIEVDRALPLEAVLETEVRKGEEILDRAEDYADQVDYEVEGELLQAREAGPAVIEEAMEKEVDLIVIGLPDKRRFGEISLGSTVPHILKNAPCRVVLCRPPLS